MYEKRKMKESILSTLKSQNSLSISKIAEKVGISASTASKFIHILEAEKKVKIEKFGNMKLVSVKK